MEYREFIGKTVIRIENYENQALLFWCSDGTRHIIHHIQDCCEQVYIEDICGELNSLVGSPITMAEESSKSGYNDYDHETWTFYKFATINGYVTIRWYGTSNGYYSEDAWFHEIDEDDYEWIGYLERFDK